MLPNMTKAVIEAGIEVVNNNIVEPLLREFTVSGIEIIGILSVGFIFMFLIEYMNRKESDTITVSGGESSVNNKVTVEKSGGENSMWKNQE